MATENMNDKLSIKNMLFTKVIPNRVIPIPTEGHKVYSCTDCGDKYLFQSSLEYHVNRKSVKITYSCRHCNQDLIFKNRCNLLSHIRSHAFRTATINVSDLHVEPLPLSDFPYPAKVIAYKDRMHQQSSPSQLVVTKKRGSKGHNKTICFECKEDITKTGVMYKDRQAHFMKTTSELHTCPVCLFVMPTKCALAAHTRLHTLSSPFFCPECGFTLTSKSVNYPYNHDCEGFNMMRATARIKCAVKDCDLFHPTEFMAHMLEHLKKVYKCPVCIVACFNKESIERHLATHQPVQKNFILFYQCQMCPGRLVVNTQLQNHLKSHSGRFAYPCWQCNIIFPDIYTVLYHHKSNTCSKKKTFDISTIESEKFTESNSVSEHDKGVEIVTPMETDTVTAKLNEKHNETNANDDKNLYRVVKKCDRCDKFFTYRCKYYEIATLPSECPYKCSEEENVMDDVMVCRGTEDVNNVGEIVCPLCNSKISMSWKVIKQHYAEAHKEYRCLDATVKIERLANLGMYIKKKRRRNRQKKPTGIIKTKLGFRVNKNNPQKTDKPVEKAMKKKDNNKVPTVSNSEFPCNKCVEAFDSKIKLEEHLLSHKDPCMAYQCLECGQCFVVKSSFSTHLLLVHGNSDVDEYVAKNKGCYNEDALAKHQNTKVNDEPVRENQCSICRDQFGNPDDLQMHFRVHGMAFLIKTTKNKSSP